MSTKTFLTSGLILGLAISPAIADDSLYKDTNIGSSCTADFLGSDSGDAVNSFLAQYTPNDYPVNAGSYLPARAIEGVQCPANSWCAGGTYTFSETSDSGIESCPAGFTLSAAGTSDENDCYHTCTANDIENSSKVASIKGGTVTKGGTNTCTATCTTGYTFKAASAGSNPLSGKESIEGITYGYKNDIEGTYGWDESSTDEYDITENQSWATEFEYGIVRGIASCNDTEGDNNDDMWDNDSSNWTKPGNEFNQITTGFYCWCKITGYTPIGGTLQDLSASSFWVFLHEYYDTDDEAARCAHDCAARCGYYVQAYADLRGGLFGSVGATSEPAACVANEITVTWDRANGQGSVTNTCTYDGDITLPTAPTKTGYTFSGWKLVTGSSSNE